MLFSHALRVQLIAKGVIRPDEWDEIQFAIKYDYLEDNIKEMMKAKKGIYVEYNHFKDRQGTERDLVRYLNVEKQNMEYTQLLETQKRLTEYAISKYEEEMKKKIDENPSAFISVSEPKV